MRTSCVVLNAYCSIRASNVFYHFTNIIIYFYDLSWKLLKVYWSIDNILFIHDGRILRF